MVVYGVSNFDKLYEYISFNGIGTDTKYYYNIILHASSIEFSKTVYGDFSFGDYYTRLFDNLKESNVLEWCSQFYDYSKDEVIDGIIESRFKVKTKYEEIELDVKVSVKNNKAFFSINILKMNIFSLLDVILFIHNLYNLVTTYTHIEFGGAMINIAIAFLENMLYKVKCRPDKKLYVVFPILNFSETKLLLEEIRESFKHISYYEHFKSSKLNQIMHYFNIHNLLNEKYKNTAINYLETEQQRGTFNKLYINILKGEFNDSEHNRETDNRCSK